LNAELTVRHYELRTPKLQSAVRLLLITDLHSCYYGEGQAELVRAIDQEAPDAILLGGDIADDSIPIYNTEALLAAVADRYPCFYVSGNHEYWSGDIEAIKDVFREYGVAVLEGEYLNLSVRGQTVTVCGVDDPESGRFAEDLSSVAECVSADRFTVLLTHRPEHMDRYVAYGFDLALAGHAHGGLWRIPGVLNGLFVPNQGLFPKYAGGQYEEQQTTMIVSRGLARESTRIPRIFNPPELAVVDLLPLTAPDSSSG
jgi:predicted MPP superfamily phosphohydrolase